MKIRRKDDSYVIIKKTVVKKGDNSVQWENNIEINAAEFRALSKLDCNQLKKIRYFYPYRKHLAEIDVFSGKLRGLVLVDFEFSSRKEAENFSLPAFCLADVTQEDSIAGGVLCRHSLASLQSFFKRFNYKKIN